MTRRMFLALFLSGWVGLVAVGCAQKGGRPIAATQPIAHASSPRLASIFSDNMVLQRNMAAPVWGWAAPGEKITVCLAGQKKTAVADKDGAWLVRLDSMPAGGPFEMSVSGNKGSLTLRNVLVGEVWVCSGQSNMQWPVKQTQNGEQAAAAANNPNLRLYYVPRKPADVPVANVDASWVECEPKAVADFSAVAYYFGKDLQEKLGVPVGLIHTSWGGTAVELWMSKESLLATDAAHYQKKLNEYDSAEKAIEKWKADAAQAKAEGKAAPPQPRKPAARPSGLYNGMIAPLIPYGIAGAIWYQGESNAGDAVRYRALFPAMIRQWRADWGQGEFPFLFVQLANYMKREEQPTDPDWAWLREAQTMTLSLPKTGMAVIIDIGEANDIHPKNKLDVGKRLSLAAQAIAYGRKVVYSGPMYDSMKTEGNRIRVKFNHVGGGLSARGGDLKGFAIAGEDRKFVWANAKIEGDSVVVWSDEVARPVAVRYAWANNPECNLYNAEGLPASPFRTDSWEKQAPAR